MAHPPWHLEPWRLKANPAAYCGAKRRYSQITRNSFEDVFSVNSVCVGPLLSNSVERPDENLWAAMSTTRTSTKTVHIVRHGESMHNVMMTKAFRRIAMANGGGRFSVSREERIAVMREINEKHPHPDPALSHHGRAQARSLRHDRVVRNGAKVLIASSMRRALMTARLGFGTVDTHTHTHAHTHTLCRPSNARRANKPKACGANKPKACGTSAVGTAVVHYCRMQ